MRAAEVKIAGSFPAIVDAMLDLALGVYVDEEREDGTIKRYRRAPDRRAAEYLINRIMGKPAERREVEGAIDIDQKIGVMVYIPDNMRDNSEYIRRVNSVEDIIDASDSSAVSGQEPPQIPPSEYDKFSTKRFRATVPDELILRLGTVSDYQLGREYGVPRATVTYYRRKYGISAYSTQLRKANALAAAEGKPQKFVFKRKKQCP